MSVRVHHETETGTHTSTHGCACPHAYKCKKKICAHARTHARTHAHTHTHTVGTALLWMGWFGFNGGSALVGGNLGLRELKHTHHTHTHTHTNTHTTHTYTHTHTVI
jgi:ammonia channel protein AmtB